MKRFLSKFFPIIPILFVVISAVLPNSCANTTNPPSGGDKDTIPPVIVGLSPLPGSTNVPTNTKIYITFNEYVKVTDPKAIVISPPMEKAPKFKMRGKTVMVYFESELQKNTTYTLDLTGAIADNNEGNEYPGYTLHFSTGETIDDKVVTGTVYDCSTLNPITGATVMLYKDLSDSAVYNGLPDAVMKTDKWGYFALRNLPDTNYRLYAIMDEMNNNIYDIDNDKIAFVDSIIRPVTIVNDTMPELLKYDMRDTTKCLARNSEFYLYMFKERPSRQYIKEKKRTSDRSGYVTFMASDTKIDSLWIRGISSDRIIAQFNYLKDSLELWVNDQRRMPDTLHLFIDYLKTDSTGVDSPFTEKVALVSENSKAKSKSYLKDIKHEDTTCVLSLKAQSETVEQYGYSLEFNYPIINEDFNSMLLISINPRQQQDTVKFTVSRDTTNLRLYKIMPEVKLVLGYDYKLKIPERIFRDINGFYNDSTEVSVSLPKDENLSKLTLNLTNVSNRYIVDLLNEKRDNVLRSYVIDENSVLDFPYLKAGNYSIRITEDLNRNGFVDTGNLLKHLQPEKVKFYKLEDGAFIIEVLAGSEMSQDVDVAELFKEQ